MYEDADLIPLSAVQHYVYCPRQCALIHLEQIWTENVFTAEGRVLHDKADSGKAETRGDVKTVTGLLLRSMALGVTGKADVVEFHRRAGAWQPFPVEYKRGRPKSHDSDRIQLCLQAMCLEEMLDIPVPEGALFYGKTRRREAVAFSAELREKSASAALAVHRLLREQVMPAPTADERCAHCSLVEACQPLAVGEKIRAAHYLESLRGVT